MIEFQVGDEVRILNGGWFGKTGKILWRADSYSPDHEYFYRVWIAGVDKITTYYDDEMQLLQRGKENETMAEIKDSGERTEYRKAIENLMDRQKDKGLSKYGVTLEDNETLTTGQRIEHLEEELIDGLMYCEHLKKVIGEGSSLTADDYQRAALRTAQTEVMSRDQLLLNGVMGLCGEAGECIDLIKKVKFQGHAIDYLKLKHELGDVAWYLAVAAYGAGFDLSEVMEDNIEKLKERYPEGFDKARSIGRKEYTKSEPN